MHSWPIMVESMSARNSALRRVAAGWTMMSIGGARKRVRGSRFQACALGRFREEVGGDRAIERSPSASCRARRSRGASAAARRAMPGHGRIRVSRRACEGTGRGEDQGGAHRRSDRERQVRAGDGDRPAHRRHGGQRRFDAGLCRSAHHHRAPERSGGSQPSAPALRPCRRGGEPFGDALCRRCRGRAGRAGA